VLVARTRAELHDALNGVGRITLVPTMGALHDGHRALLQSARPLGETVVMSLFVNPTQFGPGEDFAAYPRDEARDLAIAEADGVDVVFAPSVEEMYPHGAGATSVDPGPLATILEGVDRPGHFRGVATVVTKLFGIVRPQVALFGQKDWQQLVVIRQVTRDLELGVEVVGVPTVREPDGLALSSRNAYLANGDHELAATLSTGLLAAQSAYRAGERSERELVGTARAALAVEPQYLELRQADTLAAYDPGLPAVLLVAARVGRTRLIDNVPLSPDSRSGGSRMTTRPRTPAPGTPAPGKLSLPELAELKRSGQPIVMVTAYDYPSGRIADDAGVDLVLVGDSAAMVRPGPRLDRPGHDGRDGDAGLGRDPRLSPADGRRRPAVRQLPGRGRRGSAQRHPLPQGCARGRLSSSRVPGRCSTGSGRSRASGSRSWAISGSPRRR
jgi:pantoate--beta-alanine ligase